MLGTPRGIDAPAPVRVALNRPAPESESLFAEWMDDEGADSASRPERRELAAAGGLAERLASPAVGMAAVAEVSQ